MAAKFLGDHIRTYPKGWVKFHEISLPNVQGLIFGASLSKKKKKEKLSHLGARALGGCACTQHRQHAPRGLHPKAVGPTSGITLRVL